MLKLVKSFILFLVELVPNYFLSTTGIPKSEFMARSSEIKVLNSKEVEGVREACRVSKLSLRKLDSCINWYT